MLLHSGTSLLTSLSCSCDCAQLTGQPCQDGERLSPSLWRPEATYISLCQQASPANVWNCSGSSKTLLGHLSRLEPRIFCKIAAAFRSSLLVSMKRPPTGATCNNFFPWIEKSACIVLYTFYTVSWWVLTLVLLHFEGSWSCGKLVVVKAHSFTISMRNNKSSFWEAQKCKNPNMFANFGHKFDFSSSFIWLRIVLCKPCVCDHQISCFLYFLTVTIFC